VSYLRFRIYLALDDSPVLKIPNNILFIE